MIERKPNNLPNLPSTIEQFLSPEGCRQGLDIAVSHLVEHGVITILEGIQEAILKSGNGVRTRLTVEGAVDEVVQERVHKRDSYIGDIYIDNAFVDGDKLTPKIVLDMGEVGDGVSLGDSDNIEASVKRVVLVEATPDAVWFAIGPEKAHSFMDFPVQDLGTPKFEQGLARIAALRTPPQE